MFEHFCWTELTVCSDHLIWSISLGQPKSDYCSQYNIHHTALALGQINLTDFFRLSTNPWPGLRQNCFKPLWQHRKSRTVNIISDFFLHLPGDIFCPQRLNAKRKLRRREKWRKGENWHNKGKSVRPITVIFKLFAKAVSYLDYWALKGEHFSTSPYPIQQYYSLVIIMKWNK